jgi:hypothetical protein
VRCVRGSQRSDAAARAPLRCSRNDSSKPFERVRECIDFDDGYDHHRCHIRPREYARSTIPSVSRKRGASFFLVHGMRVRRIAVLIDGAFFLKRLPKLVEPQFCTTPQQVTKTARLLCKRHVLRLAHMEATQDSDGQWLDHVYRLFYYDAEPFDGVAHHPLLNRRMDFGAHASRAENRTMAGAVQCDGRAKRRDIITSE